MFSAVADFLGFSSRKIEFDFEFYGVPENGIPATEYSRQFGGLFTPKELSSALDKYVDIHNFWRAYITCDGAMQAVLSNDDDHGVRVVGYAPEHSGWRAKAGYVDPIANQIASAVVTDLDKFKELGQGWIEKWVKTRFAIPETATAVLRMRSRQGICAAWERTDSGIQMVVNKLNHL